MESYLYLKSLHIIFVVTWFAGLFYIVRLFIYYKEAEDKQEPDQSILKDQYLLMSKRLWYMITWPSAVLASIFGFWLIYLNPAWLDMSWMLIKLAFVALLFAYHGSCQYYINKMVGDENLPSSNFLRLWNEVATLVLFAVVFLAVLKNSINWIWGVVGIILFGILLMIGIRFYKKVRAKKSWDKFEKELIEKDKKLED